jgi:peptide/nickel transport system substrate-binding protein
VTIRFIGDPPRRSRRCCRATSTFPRAAVARSVAQFKADPRFNV